MPSKEAMLSIPARVDTLELALSAVVMTLDTDAKERLLALLEELGDRRSPFDSSGLPLTSHEAGVRDELLDKLLVNVKEWIEIGRRIDARTDLAHGASKDKPI